MEADAPRAAYVCLVCGGLEDVAAGLIGSSLGIPADQIEHVCLPPLADQWAEESASGVFAGVAGAGKLRIELPRPSDIAGWAAQRSALAAIQCTQALLAPICSVSAVGLDRASGLDQIRAAASDAPGWADALATWRDCRAEPLDRMPPLAFRASTVRDGTHAYSSIDVSRAVGDAVFESAHVAKAVEAAMARGGLTRGDEAGGETGGGVSDGEAGGGGGLSASRRVLRVDLCNFDLEVVAVLLQGELLLGLNLLHGLPFLKAEPTPLLPHSDISARLRPSTAHLLLALADVTAGDVVIDPMCGVGTLPVVGAAACAGAALCLGGDIEADCVAQAHLNAIALDDAARRSAATSSRELRLTAQGSVTPWHIAHRLYSTSANSRENRRAAPVDMCRWSAASLPLRTSSVDVAVCDLPFGAVHKVKFGTGGADVGAAARGLYAGACGVKALYACATWEVARVLRPRGRFVALTTSCRALMAHYEPQAAARLWVEIAPPRRVNCGGYLAWVLAWRRTDTPYRAEMRVQAERAAAEATAARARANREAASRPHAPVQHVGTPVAGQLGRHRRRRQKNGSVRPDGDVG